ncbi:hypothetical protein GCM10008015_29260 [Flavobacterium palustre]|uniref:TIR domain-containing protein n=1 Tax=Flavobacterium palustre TaxID=1476463 RepID=A0ABQ1HQZ2_9FLAO|nr:hypothetical protein [Flavobacterium palustre]GGA86739.1 hypothetical protein GCM10008015_29260 [Flavobacterium palustre]
MYRGFNLKIQEKFTDEDLVVGWRLFEHTKEKAEEALDSFLLENSSLDGNKLMEKWFPNLPCHVFLSHSRNDFKQAITISGMLYNKFKIITFIDSVVWMHCNELLKKIDNDYCKNENENSYNYEKRNYSTAHVHLMLSSSLNKMIDSSECLFFLNTPNSISTKNEISQKTNSPWIFSEIATSQIIRKQTPKRLRRLTKSFSATEMNESLRTQLSVEYELELSHLTDLNSAEFLKWINTHASSPEDALDNLYEQKSINTKFLL